MQTPTLNRLLTLKDSASIPATTTFVELERTADHSRETLHNWERKNWKDTPFLSPLKWPDPTRVKSVWAEKKQNQRKPNPARFLLNLIILKASWQGTCVFAFIVLVCFVPHLRSRLQGPPRRLRSWLFLPPVIVTIPPKSPNGTQLSPVILIPVESRDTGLLSNTLSCWSSVFACGKI